MEKKSSENYHFSYDQKEDVLSILQTINQEYITFTPGYGFNISFTKHPNNENKHYMHVLYHTTEVYFPQRELIARDSMNVNFKDWLKLIKKHFKKRTGKTINLKFVKNSEMETVNKASLNDRYDYKVYRIYEF